MSSRPPAVAFDKSHDACTACHEDTSERRVTCVSCDMHVHPSCYPHALTSREWTCELCDASLLQAQCGLCGQRGDSGIMQKLTEADARGMRLIPSEHQSTPRFVHSFCLRLWSHPQATPPAQAARTCCATCDKPYARLRCHACSVSFHPFCGLHAHGLLTHTEDGEILVSCSKHRKRPAISPATLPAANHTPVVKRERSDSPVHATAPVPSSRIPVPVPTGPLVSVASRRSEPAAASNFIVAAPAPSSSSTKAAKSVRDEDEKKEKKKKKKKEKEKEEEEEEEEHPTESEKAQFKKVLAASRSPPPPPPSETSKSSKSRNASTVIASSPKKTKAATPTTAPSVSKLLSKSAAAPAPAAKHATKPAAAAASSKSAASPSKKKLKRVHEISSSDEDDWTNEFQTEENTRHRQRTALIEIKSAHEEEKAIPEDSCRVCGEDWSETALDANGNPMLGPGGESLNDEMVQCDGCDCFYHESCYGIPGVPSGDYFCWPCKNKAKRGSVKCVICASKEWRGFCEVKYGPKASAEVLKASKKSKHYAHTSCVFWHHEPSFEMPEYRNPAVDVELIDRALWKLPCDKCTRADGAKLQCQFQDCVKAVHVLCMLRHPDVYFFDAHEWDEDTSDEFRPNKEFFCRRHSKRRLLQRKRQELLDDGESTTEIDAELARPEKVVPTTALLPASKLVSVVAPRQGGRSKRVVIEVDPEDQDTRAAAYEQIKREEEEARAKSSDDDEEDVVMVDAGRSPPPRRLRRKRHSTCGIDEADHRSSDDAEEIDSDSSAASSVGHKRLKKLADEPRRMKVEITTAPSSKRVKRAHSPQLASSHPLSTAYINSQVAPVIDTSTTPQIEARSKVRRDLTEVLDAEVANAVEAELFRACGRRTDQKYSQRWRDISMNLKANISLATSVLVDDVTPERLVSMTNAEMASSALKATRAAEAKEDLLDHTSASQAVFVKPSGQRVTLDLGKMSAVTEGEVKTPSK